MTNVKVFKEWPSDHWLLYVFQIGFAHFNISINCNQTQATIWSHSFNSSMCDEIKETRIFNYTSLIWCFKTIVWIFKINFLFFHNFCLFVSLYKYIYIILFINSVEYTYSFHTFVYNWKITTIAQLLHWTLLINIRIPTSLLLIALRRDFHIKSFYETLLTKISIKDTNKHFRFPNWPIFWNKRTSRWNGEHKQLQ